MINFELLRKPFPESEWDWRVQYAKLFDGRPSILIVPYVDARAIQTRLDEVCTPQGWQVHYRHENGGVMCILSVKCDSEWVSKEDGSDPTENEPFKGSVSKSLVRAASAWGIGRHLYEQTPEYAKVVSKESNGAKSVKIDGQNYYWVRESHPSRVQAESRQTQAQPSTTGEFVFSFGKFKGLTLKDVPIDQLENYESFLKENKSGKPVPPSVLNFFAAMDEFCGRNDDICL